MHTGKDLSFAVNLQLFSIAKVAKSTLPYIPFTAIRIPVTNKRKGLILLQE